MDETNGRTLSSEQAFEILRHAFKPLFCVAQSQNVGTLIVFEVSDGTKRMLKHGIPAAFAHKDYILRTQIMNLKTTVPGFNFVSPRSSVISSTSGNPKDIGSRSRMRK